ncbi:MAG: peptidyl-prolyl cis-trans isomerase [Fimbriimonadaceae bacterium]|nr:peptidyl-prolyl cis-trans isomerase [Fimbriimonadaceae bacterium]
MKRPAILFTCAVLAACVGAQSDPNRLVMTVNGDEIRADEYYRRMEFLTGVGKRVGDGFVEFPPGLLTIEQLVYERLMKQLAVKKGVLPTPTMVQQEIQYRIEENPKLLEEWDRTALPRTALDEQIFLELLEFRLYTFGITVTDAQVDEFYNENKPMFTTPARAELRMIAVADEAGMSAADADLAANKPFAEVARKHSTDVSKAAGGDFGIVAYDQLPPGIADAVRGAADGKTTGWLKIQDSHVKFLKVKSYAEELQKLDAPLRRSIRRRLMLDRGRIKNDVVKEINELRAKSAVDIKQAMLADAWKRLNQSHLRSQGAGG